jgi:molybdopterin/thiamine biosynthesis adenylyltransferase
MFLDEQYRQAANAVEQWLQNCVPGSQKLDVLTIRNLDVGHYLNAWRLPLPVTGQLLVLLDPDFPYSLPRFVLEGRGDLLNTPHVEASGKLCIKGDNAPADTLSPVRIVEYLYHEALCLVTGNENGENNDDFIADFDAYWRRTTNNFTVIRTWLLPTHASRTVSLWAAKQFLFVADSNEDANLWLNNRYGITERRTFKEAALIWLNNLPEPDQYPNSAHDARKLIQQSSPDGIQVFDRLMAEMDKDAVVIFSGERGTGYVVQVALLIENPRVFRGGPKSTAQQVIKGFRPGRAPPQILANRRTAQRAETQQVDAWRTRLRPGDVEKLVEKRVSIIGCGSLGSGVAKLLLQSGLGHIRLVDPETFSFANVARHELGADSFGQYKATALVEKFKPMYPHIRELSAEPKSWQTALRDNHSLFADVDLVLSLIANWNAESALNDLQRSGTGELNSTIIYGWLEEQAAASHAVAIDRVGACLRCGFTSTGSVRTPVTTWQEAKDTGCAAPTSAYGAIELAPAQALVAALAIDVLLDRAAPPVHRVWLGNRNSMKIGGGEWHPKWKHEYGDPRHGNQATAIPWQKSGDCTCLH